MLVAQLARSPRLLESQASSVRPRIIGFINDEGWQVIDCYDDARYKRGFTKSREGGVNSSVIP